MADEIQELNLSDFGFSTAETLQDDLIGTFTTAKPEEVTEIKEEEPVVIPEKPPVLTPDLLETLPSEEEEPPVIEEPGEEKINPFKAFSGILAEEGLISLEEGEEIKEGEELLVKVREQAQRVVVEEFENILSRYGQDRADAFRAIYMNGVDPREYFQTQEKLESVRNLDLAEEDNQELVLKQAFKQQGLSDARIKSRIQGFKDLGTMEEEAKEAHELLVNHEEQYLENLEEQKIQEQQAKIQYENHYCHSIGQLINQKLTTKEIDGMPLNKKEAQAIYEDLTAKKWKLPNGEELTELDKWWLDLKKPENYELRLKIAALRRLDFDLSKVVKKEASQIINNKFDFLTQKEKTVVRTNTKTNSPFTNL